MKPKTKQQTLELSFSSDITNQKPLHEPHHSLLCTPLTAEKNLNADWKNKQNVNITSNVLIQKQPPEQTENAAEMTVYRKLLGRRRRERKKKKKKKKKSIVTNPKHTYTQNTLFFKHVIKSWAWFSVDVTFWFSLTLNFGFSFLTYNTRIYPLQIFETKCDCRHLTFVLISPHSSLLQIFSTSLKSQQ